MDAFELEHERTRMNENGAVHSHSYQSSLLGVKISSPKSGATKLIEVEKFLENSSRKF